MGGSFHSYVKFPEGTGNHRFYPPNIGPLADFPLNQVSDPWIFKNIQSSPSSRGWPDGHSESLVSCVSPRLVLYINRQFVVNFPKKTNQKKTQKT